MMGTPDWEDVSEEINEFLTSNTKGEYIEETADIIHSLCRYMKLPNRVTWILAHDTATKHAARMLVRGCPKSERNCKKAAQNCCCKKKDDPLKKLMDQIEKIIINHGK